MRGNTPVDLIIVAGQSNAVGFDADPALLPVDATDNDILFWWRCGDPPPDANDSTSAAKWTHLQSQPSSASVPSGLNDPPVGNFRSERGGFGPEMELGRRLRREQGRPLAILKVAWNGTSLRRDWSTEGDGGAAYRALIVEWQSATRAALSDGIELRPRALVWLQGESDASPQDIPVYAAGLIMMIRSLRTQLAVPDLPVLVGVNANYGDPHKVRGKMRSIVEAQKSVAATVPNCRFVDTQGATLANLAHFDAAGTLEVGRRYAEALLDLERDDAVRATEKERADPNP